MKFKKLVHESIGLLGAHPFLIKKWLNEFLDSFKLSDEGGNKTFELFNYTGSQEWEEEEVGLAIVEPPSSLKKENYYT